MVDNIPPSDNRILGHVIHRLIEHSLPPQVESTAPELPSFAIKGCLLGKTFSGKTTALKFLQKYFPIEVLSIDTLVQEAIQAFHNNEKVSGALQLQKAAEEKASPVRQESGDRSQASMISVFFSAPCVLKIDSWMACKRSRSWQTFL